MHMPVSVTLSARSSRPITCVITHACFGIAGPIQHGRSEAINLAWVVDAEQLAQQLGLASGMAH